MADAMQLGLKAPMVIDNGTGYELIHPSIDAVSLRFMRCRYTKMGFAGNSEPNFIVPTVIANATKAQGKKVSEIQDMDFYIGKEAIDARHNYAIDYPIRHGIIDNW